jgi:hypothetical protein
MVQRRAGRGAKTGGFFWGCSRYPACRGTIDIPSISPTPDSLAGPSTSPVSPSTLANTEMPGGGAIIGTAGGSARRTYERRRQTHNAQRADRLARAVPRAAVAGIATGVLMSAAGQALALVFGGAVAIAVLLETLVVRPSTTAWRTGSDGEERTASSLDGLAADGFVVFHDRSIPSSSANIDHLVVGPTGVFVVETKNIAGDFRVRGDEVRIGGRRVGLVDEVRREVDATWTAVAPVLGPKGLAIIPIVCAHRASLPFFRRQVDGIRIVDGRGLARFIRGGRQVLSPAEIADLRRRVEVILPPK